MFNFNLFISVKSIDVNYIFVYIFVYMNLQLQSCLLNIMARRLPFLLSTEKQVDQKFNSFIRAK